MCFKNLVRVYNCSGVYTLRKSGAKTGLFLHVTDTDTYFIYCRFYDFAIQYTWVSVCINISADALFIDITYNKKFENNNKRCVQGYVLMLSATVGAELLTMKRLQGWSRFGFTFYLSAVVLVYTEAFSTGPGKKYWDSLHHNPEMLRVSHNSSTTQWAQVHLVNVNLTSISNVV